MLHASMMQHRSVHQPCYGSLAHTAAGDGAHDGAQRCGLRVAQQRPQQRALHHQLRLVLLARQPPRETALG